MSDKTLQVWECECGYTSLQPGKCRSHPYPCRAMGPDMGPPVIYIPLNDAVAMVMEAANE